MRILSQLLLLVAFMFSGCDSIYVVSRDARVRTMPDILQVKARIERYPEIQKVNFEKCAGSRPFTMTGIKPADEVFYLNYSGGKAVRGTLWFERNYKGEVQYHQSLIEINRKPPQIMIDATWPVMKKIESDLENVFGLYEIRDSLKVVVTGVQNPERETLNKAPEPTPTAGTYPAAQVPRQP